MKHNFIILLRGISGIHQKDKQKINLIIANILANPLIQLAQN